MNFEFRRIHLDFHTSEKIQEVASLFDKNYFVKILKEASVDSVTCFSRCHHGMLYYDSKKFPERIHPYLKNKNILAEQIEVCHKNGIRVPIYLPVEWDSYTANKHPEWLVRDEFGRCKQGFFDAGFYNNLCVNTPYLEFLKEQIDEIMEMFKPVDGLFLDILNIKDCCCKYCINSMLEEGIDVEVKSERVKFAQKKLDKFKENMTKFIRERDDKCDIFYNVDHIGTKHRNSIHNFSHLEIESLPSGMWGYMHYPVTARYARTLSSKCIGMTGKFHTSWGDFHSFKNKEALEFECFSMLAFNMGCSIGDQLHPNGKLCSESYKLIGDIYKSVKEKEAWCIGAKEVVEIGVMAVEEFLEPDQKLVTDDVVGATRILQELGYQFNIIDSYEKFEKYKLIVLPDNIIVNDRLSKKISIYIKNGGKLISSYKSGMDENSIFNIDELGIEFIGESKSTPNFISIVDEKINVNIENTEHVIYDGGLEIKNRTGKVLANAKGSYFNRTWDHYCSHMHTPCNDEIIHPSIIQGENIIYFSHPIFTEYEKNAPRFCKQLIKNTINCLIGNSILQTDGHSGLLTTLNKQEDKNRYIIHIINYIPRRNNKNIDTISDIVELASLNIQVKLDTEIKYLRKVPSMELVNYIKNEEGISFNLKGVKGHEMLELVY